MGKACVDEICKSARKRKAMKKLKEIHANMTKTKILELCDEKERLKMSDRFPPSQWMQERFDEYLKDEVENDSL